MKKPNWPKFTSEIYKEAGYSDEIIANIECWESQHSSVESMLSEYRYVQPDGELFSEHSLQIIIALHDMEHMLKAQRETTYDIERKLRNLMNLTFKEKSEFIDDFLLDDSDFK